MYRRLGPYPYDRDALRPCWRPTIPNERCAEENSGTAVRGYWCDIAGRLATPVLDALSRRRLKAEMPVQVHVDRADYTDLEALGRLVCGLAPWLELGGDSSAEGQARKRYAVLAL